MKKVNHQPREDGYLGFEMASAYSDRLKRALETIYTQVIKDIPHAKTIVAVYGSAARNEMAADSDADVLLVSNDSLADRKFKARFILELEKYNYSKVDIPNWGHLSEISKIIETSLIEGNQILESSFLVGDQSIKEQFTALVRKSDTLERALRNLVFQKYCYQSYYAKRRKPNLINIKYSEGGTRDLLFFIWVAKLGILFHDLRAVRSKSWKHDATLNPLRNFKCVSRVFQNNEALADLSVRFSIQVLSDLGFLPTEKIGPITQAASTITLFRSEMLKANKETELRGLSFFNPKLDFINSSAILSKCYRTSKMAADDFIHSAKIIAGAKASVIDGLSHRYLDRTQQKVLAGREDFDTILRHLNTPDPKHKIIKTACIWELNNRFDYSNYNFAIKSIIANHDLSWEEIASIVSIDDLEAEILDDLCSRILSKEHHGYILRIISQHQHVSRKTLKRIVGSQSDKRYLDLAKIALAKGSKEANYQI